MPKVQVNTRTGAPKAAESEFCNVVKRLVRSPVALLWIVCIACCVLWRLFVLGFYADDWPVIVASAQAGSAFSWQRLLYTQSIDRARPGMFPSWFILSSLLEDQALLWHVGLLIVNLTIVIALVLMVALFTGRRGMALAVPCGGAAAWLILPWNATFLFWPTELPVLLTLSGFALCGIILLKDQDTSPKRDYLRWLSAGLLYFWVCISYEAFYFQFVPLLLFAALARWGKSSLRHRVPAAISLIGAQATASGWYFLAKRITNVQRPIEADWPRRLVENVWGLVPQLLRSASLISYPLPLSSPQNGKLGQSYETAIVGVLLAAVWLVYSGLVYWKALRSRDAVHEARKSLLAVIVCLVAVGLSVLAYSMGNRIVSGLGVDARTFLFFNFWGVLALSLVMEFVAGRTRSPRAYASLSLALGLTLMAGNIQRALEWSRAWRAAEKIVKEAPVAQMREAGSNAMIVLVSPRDINGGPIFLAPYEINAAMQTSYNSYFSGVAEPGGWSLGKFLVYNPSLGVMTWDGNRLRYPLQPAEAFEPGHPAYVWKPQSNQFWKAEAPFQIEQDLNLGPLRR